MTTNSDKKLMSLLDNHVPGTVLLASWLEKNGISRDLQQYYLKSGWLESYGSEHSNGQMKMCNGRSVELITKTNQNCKCMLVGLTSISLQGLSHYVRMEKESLYLFSPQYVKLPKWFLNSGMEQSDSTCEN
jgi:hypothetical protein